MSLAHWRMVLGFSHRSTSLNRNNKNGSIVGGSGTADLKKVGIDQESRSRNTILVNLQAVRRTMDVRSPPSSYRVADPLSASLASQQVLQPEW